MRKIVQTALWIAAAGSVALGTAAAASNAPHCVAPPAERDALGLRSGPPAAVNSAGLRELVPPSGAVHVLVLLAEFADLPHGIDPSRFETMLFGGGASMRQYYLDASEGALSVTGDVHGWYTLPGSLDFYSGGANGVGSYPTNAQRMAEDAVAAAVADGLDLGDYDADGDGVVDALLVVHSGQGVEWAGSPALTPIVEANQINSHKWVVRQGDFGSGARVEDYFTCPELQRVIAADYPAWSDSLATVGVYCHEFGHMLGLPDFYDTQTSESRVGIWDVMDAGLWAGDPSVPGARVPGSLPARFSPFSRATLGWAEPFALDPAVGESADEWLTLESAHAGAPGWQLRFNPSGYDWENGDPGLGEYFLAEVRTAQGWDAGLPVSGLILYHVDESAATNRAASAPVEGGALLELVPADDDFRPQTTSGDPWTPATPRFDATSDPGSALFDGSESGVSLSDIGPLFEGVVQLRASVVNLGVAPPTPFARPQPFSPSVHGVTRIVLTLGDPASAGTVVRIHDLRGRLVRILDADALTSEGRIAEWDGRDRRGRPVPAGVYFFRADGGLRGTGRVNLLR